MATSKSADEKTKATGKPVAKTAEKPKAPRGIPAPSIKPAAVVVPAMSVVGGMSGTASAKDDTASDTPRMLKKQELVDRIVLASGAKKKDVKLMMEAALGVLGDALSAGEELNLPPLGKVKVNKQRQEGNAEVLILRLRRGGGSGGGTKTAAVEALMEDDD